MCARSIGQFGYAFLFVLGVVLVLLPNSILGQTLTRRPEQQTFIFLPGGRDVVYPKDMSMTIALGKTEKQPCPVPELH